MKSNILILMAAVAVAAVAISGCKPKSKAPAETAPAEAVSPAFDPDSLAEEPVFKIRTTLGTITVRLYSDTPLHRNNFEKLASQRFYDGILFHRVINGFMIQTGDPYSKDTSKTNLVGTGGPGYNIPAEIVAGHTHKKGALAAARRGDEANPKRESSGSQFYIVQNEGACKQLDGAYTVFGETVDGFDVIDRIAAVPTDDRDRPMNDVKILSILPVNEAAKSDAAAVKPVAVAPVKEAPKAPASAAPAEVKNESRPEKKVAGSKTPSDSKSTLFVPGQKKK